MIETHLTRESRNGKDRVETQTTISSDESFTDTLQAVTLGNKSTEDSAESLCLYSTFFLSLILNNSFVRNAVADHSSRRKEMSMI